MRKTLGSLILASSWLAASCACAQSPGDVHRVSAMDYTTCWDQHARAIWIADGWFTRPIDGATFPPFDDTKMLYRTWDGSCWEARWNPKTDRFIHSPASGGKAREEVFLNFTATDGDRYSMLRDGDDFILIFVSHGMPSGEQLRQAMDAVRSNRDLAKFDLVLSMTY